MALWTNVVNLCLAETRSAALSTDSIDGLFVYLLMQCRKGKTA